MKKYHKSSEPIWWLPFIAGGGLAAMVLPGIIIAIGMILPLGFAPCLESHTCARRLIGNILLRLFLFLFISLSFFHWAHRTRFMLIDLGIRGARPLIAALLYGTAIVGTFIAFWLTVTV